MVDHNLGLYSCVAKPENAHPRWKLPSLLQSFENIFEAFSKKSYEREHTGTCTLKLLIFKEKFKRLFFLN